MIRLERTSIAIDGAGRPHIAYKQRDWQPPDYCSGMGYASWTGSQWQIERFHDCGNFVSMALDSAGQPHITFNNSGQVKRATKQTGSWQVDDVGASNGYGSSVAVDSNDRPHVVYVDMDYGGQLIYANWDGSQWVTQSVQPADAGLYLSLTLDDADMAHIAVGRDYVVLNGANPLGVQSASAVAGSFSSIALDVDGHPAISYRGFASSVRCDRWDGSVWVTEVIDYGGSARTGNAIGLDSQDYPYISHYRTTGNGGGAIELAWRNDDGWATETISGTYVPSYAGAEYDTSLAVDSGDAPHVSFWYSEYYADGLYYGVKSGEQWQFEKIAEDADGPNDLVLDSADGPHIAFVDNGSLYYGYRSGGGWNVSDVGVEAEPRVVSLKLDGADRPRIIFVDWEDGSRILQLAAWTGTAWAVDEIATVDGNSGVQAALALDAAGKAHVAYVVNDDESGELRYAVEGGADWASEVVDSRRWGITSPNILLLEGDAPTIVYHYQGLQVATKAGGTWDVQEIFRLQYSGDVSSVADSGRRLLVSYYDGRGHGLMFAGPPFLNPTDFVYLPMALRS